MKTSYAWLSSFFDGKLPPVETVAREITFHAWEVEDVEEVHEDTVFEVKVLPDRTNHALSHRGIAREISVILNLPLSRDPLTSTLPKVPPPSSLTVSVESQTCIRYQGAIIEGVKVGPSPEWLRGRLEALGQRSINNIVDATNFVMFDLGQPLHAFDADKLEVKDGSHSINVREAREGESITTLTGETYELSPSDLLIVDGVSDTPIGIAGIKGGKKAEVDETTTRIIVEAANFNQVTTRKSSQRLKLRTDASIRFENGIVPETTEPALAEVVKLITDIAGGTYQGVAETPFVSQPKRPVPIPLKLLSSALGVKIDEAAVQNIMKRFGYTYELTGDTLTVTPPVERTDITIPEDLIEEVGRIYGYEHVPSIVPKPSVTYEINKRFVYSEMVRTELSRLGFSEVYTSSFRKKDELKLKNALASDKGYLRSTLRENITDALMKNIPNRDLLGLSSIALYELGTVFNEEGERYVLALGVRHGMEYREKADKKRLDEACAALNVLFGTALTFEMKDGVAECDFGAFIETLPEPSTYSTVAPSPEHTFKTFSVYPPVSRDIALWAPEGKDAEAIAARINELASNLLVRLTLFDEFTKENQTSYAFRLVFQSPERTLTDEELLPVMERVTEGLKNDGATVR